MVDKNDAMIEYLRTCESIRNSPLFFNFGKAKEDNNRFITMSNEKSISRPYIDGSILKSYKFTLMTHKSVAYNAIIDNKLYPDENMEEIAQFQAIIDWVTEQNDSKNFPDFGENCEIDSIESLSYNPVLEGLDTQTSPALAVYSVTIEVKYLDISKRVY